MVRFPAETHELSRSGKPWHRVERLEHIVNWFDVHLMHKPSNEYDLEDCGLDCPTFFSYGRCKRDRILTRT
jgi:hypothetical protein